MELIYSMRRKPLKYQPPQFSRVPHPEDIHPLCTISTGNVIAFSSHTELSDSNGDTWGGYVYVCDLDTPWDSHKVASTTHAVTALEWDFEGERLLVATITGIVSVYGMKEYLLNEWTCLYTVDFGGEHVLRATFFHSGRRMVAVDKKPDAPVTERLQVLRATPTLKGFGGAPCEGACVVTTTGLVGVITPPARPTPAPAHSSTAAPPTPIGNITMESLRATRDHISNVSFVHKNGNILVAAVCGQGLGQLVRCWAVSVSASGRGGGGGAVMGTRGGRALSLHVQPLPAIYLDDVTRPVSIAWCLREETDSLLVAGTNLTLWKLTERSYPVHKMLGKIKVPVQSNAPPGQKPADCFNTVVWQQVGAWACECPVWMCASRTSAAPPHVLLAAPRSLQLRTREAHHAQLYTVPLVTSGCGEGAAGGGSPPKKPKYGPGALPAGCPGAVACCAELSWLGAVAVALDSHSQLHVYRVPLPWTDMPAALGAGHAAQLLEYVLVNGLDCLDVLLGLKQSLVEPLYDRFTEVFQRQPPQFQQHYYQRWLKMRIALCRLSPALSASMCWLLGLGALQGAAAAAAAALRPDERPDAAPLAALLDDAAPQEHEKSLSALEARAEPPPEVTALAPLRRPLQRALDLAATVLAAAAHHALPHAHPHPQPHHHHGYSLWADPGGLSLLRRVVALARGATREGEALARPLARLQAAAAAGTLPKQDLAEELLSALAQAPGARLWEAAPRCAVSAPHGQPTPHYLQYGGGAQVEALRYAAEAPAFAQSDASPTSSAAGMDCIRYMYLGGRGQPARWRQCSRCGARSYPAAGGSGGAGAAGGGGGAGAVGGGGGAGGARGAALALQRAHDARYLRECRCGGKWALFSNV